MNILRKIYKAYLAPSGKDQSDAVKQEWERTGKPLPPPHQVKQQMIHAIRKNSGYGLFIETGTYLGDMVEAQKNNFQQLYSIELGADLFQNAVKRFSTDRNVTILQGDSGDVLVTLCNEIKSPAIFWLDGHYSAGITARGKKSCPIFEELQAIFNARSFGHILLIDDARLFTGVDDYPTIYELTNFIKKHRGDADLSIENDIIHVYLNDI